MFCKWGSGGMVDALVLGTSVFGRVGSSPTFPTTCPDGGMVDTRDLKSLGHCDCVGSSPTRGTNLL